MTELFVTILVTTFFVLPLVWFLLKKALGCFLILFIIGTVVAVIVYLLYSSGMTLMA